MNESDLPYSQPRIIENNSLLQNVLMQDTSSTAKPSYFYHNIPITNHNVLSNSHNVTMSASSPGGGGGGEHLLDPLAAGTQSPGAQTAAVTSDTTCEGCYDMWHAGYDTWGWDNFTSNDSAASLFTNNVYSRAPGDVVPLNWYVLLLGVIVLAGVTGNILVCIAVTIERKLQNVTNYFLLSLSIADLFVCFFVMPCSIVNEIMGYWPLGLVVCEVWQVLDVMMCTSSIMHMCTISLDRYVTMSHPLKLRNKSRSVVCIKISIVWFISLLIASPIILLGALDTHNVFMDKQCAIFNPYFLIYGSLAAFFIPLVIMLIAYSLTIHLLNEQAKKCGGMRRSRSRRTAAGGQNGSQNGMTIAKLLKATVDRGRPAAAAHPSEVEPLHRKQAMLQRSEQGQTNGGEHTGENRGDMEDNISNSYSNSNRLHTNNNTTNNRQHSSLSTSSSSTTSRGGANNLLCVDLACSHRVSQGSIQSTSSAGSYACNPTDPSSSTQQAGAPKFQTLMKKHSGAIKAAGILIAKREENIQKKQMNSVKTERKAVKVLGTMFAIFVLCWAPFFSINLAMGVCSFCDIDEALFKVFLWLGYVSSTLNPIIYTIFNKTFKKTFVRILTCRVRASSRVLCQQQRFLATPANINNGGGGTSDKSASVKVTCRYNQLPNPEEFAKLQESNV